MWENFKIIDKDVRTNILFNIPKEFINRITKEILHYRGTLRSLRIPRLAKIPISPLSWLAEILEIRKGLIIWVA